MDEQNQQPQINPQPTGSAPAPMPNPSQAPMPTPNPAQYNNYQNNPAIQNPPQEKKIWPWILVIVLVILLIGGGMVGWFLYKGNKNNAELPANNSVSEATTKEDLGSVALVAPKEDIEVNKGIFDTNKAIEQPQEGLLAFADKEIFAILNNTFGGVKLISLKMGEQYGGGTLTYIVKRPSEAGDFNKIKAGLEAAGYNDISGSAEEKHFNLTAGVGSFKKGSEEMKYKIGVSNSEIDNGQRIGADISVYVERYKAWSIR